MDALSRKLSKTPSPEELLQTLQAPQHIDGEANPAWIAARQHRVTGSTAAVVMGLSPFCGQTELIRRKLWPNSETYHGAACDWGTRMEVEAERAFEKWSASRRWAGRLAHYGLCVSRHNDSAGWLGFSPDGVWYGKHSTLLVEFKCPFKYSTKPPDPNGTAYGLHTPPDGSDPIAVPPHYWIQLQIGMFVMGHAIRGRPLERAAFVVWCPYRCDVIMVPFSRDYVTSTLLPTLHAWWLEKYVPALHLRLAGEIEEGEINRSVHVTLP